MEGHEETMVRPGAASTGGHAPAPARVSEPAPPSAPVPRKRDLRVTKTYDALTAAFAALLEEKPFEQISVTELCDRARTRRATFYKHFGDKYEFMHFVLVETRHRFVAEALGQVRGGTRRETVESMVRCALTFIEGNLDFLLALRRNDLLPTLIDLGQVDAGEIELIANRLIPAGEGERIGTFRGNLRLRFAQGALSSCALWWLDHHAEADRDEVVSEIAGLLERL